MKGKKLCLMGLLTAIALTIFMIEAQLPALAPIPGIKLGLSNIVTLFALFFIGPRETAAILACRVFLGAVFSGQMSTLLYSAAGGALSLGVSLLLYKGMTQKQIWVLGCLGAIAHNVGQLTVAVLITKTPQLWGYLPVLLVSAILTGLFTGFGAQALVKRMKKVRQKV